MGSILSGPWDVQAQKSAINRAKRADTINEKRLKDAWMQSDYFLPAFGGGASGLTTSLGKQYQDIFNATSPEDLFGSVSSRYGNFSNAADTLRPSLVQAQQIGQDVLSGETGNQRLAALAPVTEARTRGVATNRQAQTEAIAEILNRIDASQRAAGFGTSSSGTDAVRADVARAIARETAGQQAAADVANASDVNNLKQSIINERLAGMSLPQQLLQSRIAFNLTPEMQAINSVVAPYAARTGAAAPFVSVNRPPVYMKKAYPSEHGLWMKATGDALAEIEDLLVSYYSGVAASSKGSSRVGGGAATRGGQAGALAGISEGGGTPDTEGNVGSWY